MATIGVFAMIFDESDRLLCVRLNYAHCGWTTPGGRVDPMEAPLDALKREVLEETGFIVKPGSLIGIYSKPAEDDLVLCFEAQTISRDHWEPNDEIAEVSWFRQSELPENMTTIVAARVRDAFDRRRGIYRDFGSGKKSAT